MNNLNTLVEKIKQGKKISRHFSSNISIDENLIEKYDTNEVIPIAYMIANDIPSWPLCKDCFKTKLKFNGSIRGFNHYCKLCTLVRSKNRFTNNSLEWNKNRKTVFGKEYIEAKDYYLENTITIRECSKKFNLPYNTLRTYISSNGFTKKNNSHLFNLLKFQEKNPQLLDKEFFYQCIENKKSVDDICKELEIGRNTFYVYARKHGIRWHSFDRLENELIEFIKEFDPNSEKSRKIISPLEIDVFSTKINTGFEFNGLYWHSDNNIDNLYHINKQQLAEEKI